MRNKVLRFVGVGMLVLNMGMGVVEAALSPAETAAAAKAAEAKRIEEIKPLATEGGQGAKNTCDLKNDIVPLFAPPNSVWKNGDAICQISGITCTDKGCGGDNGIISCDFSKIKGKKTNLPMRMGMLGTPCELATVALSSLSGGDLVCKAGAGAINAATIDLNKGSVTSPGSTAETPTTPAPTSTAKSDKIDLACTDFLDPVPVSLLKGSMQDSYCVSIDKQVTSGDAIKDDLKVDVLKIFQVNTNQPSNTLCQAILTKTGNIGVVAGFALFAFQTIQTILIGVAIIGVVVAGIQMMFMGGSEEAQKKAKDALIKIFSGLALLFALKIILATIAPDFFTIEPAPKTNSTTSSQTR